MRKIVQLKDTVVNAMGLIFSKGEKGEEWAPRNADARFVAVKGAAKPATEPAKKGRSVYHALVERFGEERAAVAKGLWVIDGTPDGVDNDGDGAQDYEQILSILFGALGVPSPYGWDWYCSNGGVVSDLQRALSIQDPEMRSAAIACGIDNFLEALDDIRSGGDGAKKAAAIASYRGEQTTEKAGARHSSSDLKKLGEIKGHAEKILALHGDLTAAEEKKDGKTDQPASGDDAEKAAAVKAIAEWSPADVGDDGLPENYGELTVAIAKAKSSDEKAKKPYGEVEYADPGLQGDGVHRYPVDTKAHAKAAWSRINQQKNADKYSADDLKKVKDRIQAACEKFGVEISAGETGKAAPATVTATSESPGGIDAAALLGQMREILTSTVKAQSEALEASVKSQIAEVSGSVNKLAGDVEKLKGAPEPSIAATTVAAIKAAREPDAPGGLAAIDASTLQPKGNPLVDRGSPGSLPASASVRELLVHTRSLQQA